MLENHEHMWLGNFGIIKDTEHAINIIPSSRPFKSAPYQAGPKNLELEQFKVPKQPKAGVIGPAFSEFAALVLFAPKKDGKLQFCIFYWNFNQASLKDSNHLPLMYE